MEMPVTVACLKSFLMLSDRTGVIALARDLYGRSAGLDVVAVGYCIISSVFERLAAKLNGHARFLNLAVVNVGRF